VFWPSSASLMQGALQEKKVLASATKQAKSGR